MSILACCTRWTISGRLERCLQPDPSRFLRPCAATISRFDRLPGRGAYRYASKLRLAADLDLTRNDPLGFDPDKQYLRVGAEWYLWRSTAIRGGLRYNVAIGKYLSSIGLGLGTFSSHLDIAVTKPADNDQVDLALQAGFRF